MEPQNESNQKSRDDKAEKPDKVDDKSGSRGTDLEATEQQFEPFDDTDPFRATRIAEIGGQTAALLAEVSATPTNLERLAPNELRSLQQDARERERWGPSGQDVFIGFLRLDYKTPPRSARIL